MRGLPSILSLFCNEFNKFNNIGAQMSDSIYHMTLSLLWNLIAGVKNACGPALELHNLNFKTLLHNFTSISTRYTNFRTIWIHIIGGYRDFSRTKYGWKEKEEEKKNYEPVHVISNNVVCATSKASDQPAHIRSLIRAFSSRLSMLWLLSYWLNTFWSF